MKHHQIICVQKICNLQKNLSRSYITPNATKERLMTEYQRAYRYIADQKLPEDVNKLGIFANDELSLGEIDVYGYDYDYTLAAYKKATVEKMIHSLAKKDMKYYH